MWVWHGAPEAKQLFVWQATVRPCCTHFTISCPAAFTPLQCLKKRHCFGLLQPRHTSTDFDNFSTSVANKVSSQMVLYFSTLPNWCFCTTWGNRKPKIASFHLNAESCFASRHRKHIHIINWSQLNRPLFSRESAVCNKQDLRSEYSILPSVTTHSSFTKSVVMSIAVLKVGVVRCRTSIEKSMDSIGVISYYLNKC